MSNDKTTAWNNGLEVMDAVYGAGASGMMKGLEGSPFAHDTVAQMFGEVWKDPTISIRDKRLMVIGVTAGLGRADLIATQIAGALANDELSEAELAEIPRFLMYYVGAGNASAVFQGIQTAKAKRRG
ncbi:MAG: carboxymuconolactone decarboxylase family protein [Confluentimicrobium sp.]|jgi:4-carboxymuconolactone decarboxylase|uniref:carboxymuconolactone decarboxylase family protein n=1 Tax=Actibacterium sp. TaxID=1872125 RepID=UPI000510785C|nr:carboxymuconolactone decarboxylase family protein [Actibacterium sp.]KGB83806.1 hypothetical protein JT55_01340 [Rhodovulum sp. NI22]MBC57144.1 carboxymuconolactone decarboxylase family protein [Actibacterium sp.]MDY6859455.1 carboxymuconolactone decarboxylase family protein [Pseudomonadota bacterium]|tara:strand:- start:3191 stop:3571 length:381 start_codon:yes stop_codon:yes gene_type:complete